MKDGLVVSVKITDLPMFNKILDIVKGLIIDESIPHEKRQQYYKVFINAINSREEN